MREELKFVLRQRLRQAQSELAAVTQTLRHQVASHGVGKHTQTIVDADVILSADEKGELKLSGNGDINVEECDEWTLIEQEAETILGAQLEFANVSKSRAAMQKMQKKLAETVRELRSQLKNFGDKTQPQASLTEPFT